MQSPRNPVVGSAREIVVACALQKETLALRRRIGDPVRFLTTGIGVRRTRTSLEGAFQESCPSCLLFTGTAGQLDPSLELREVVFPEEWCLEGGGCFPASPEIIQFLRQNGNWQISGRGLTVSAPVLRMKSRLRLFGMTGARVCDMESAAAAETASRFGVQCLAPKVVSDTADSSVLAFWMGFEGCMDALAFYLGNLIQCLTSPENP